MVGQIISQSPTHNVSGADHALASLRESNLTLAIMSHASALAIVASKSFARRRLRLSRMHPAGTQAISIERGIALSRCGGGL